MAGGEGVSAAGLGDAAEGRDAQGYAASAAPPAGPTLDTRYFRLLLVGCFECLDLLALSMANLTCIKHVRSGPLFDVVHAQLDGQLVYVKSVGDRDHDEQRSGLASLWTHRNETNLFHTREMGWMKSWKGKPEDGPRRAHYEALLRAECDVIEAARNHWNHPGACLACRRGDELVTQGGEICLVMPACEGTPLARLSSLEQKEWIPAMLPALWRALAHCPHGDLTPDDLLLGPTGRFFRILDPGVRINGPARERGEGDTLDFDSELFTTNITHYPLLLPEHGPDHPKLTAPYTGLLDHMEAYDSGSVVDLVCSEETERPSDGASPAAADLIAVGAMYAFALTGAPLHRLLKLGAPLWSGYWNDRRRGRPAYRRRRIVQTIVGGELLRTLEAAGATRTEAELCVRLIALHINSEEDLHR